jgi:hypothetical protein
VTRVSDNERIHGNRAVDMEAAELRHRDLPSNSWFVRLSWIGCAITVVTVDDVAKVGQERR